MSSSTVLERILQKAIKRASKWIHLREDKTTTMVGQVGGRSLHKKPLLTLRSGPRTPNSHHNGSAAGYEYVLKPLSTDHRGIREIAFYEALEVVVQTSTSISQAYANFLGGTDSSTAKKSPRSLRQSAVLAVEAFDTLALAFAMMMKDAVVKQSEEQLRDAWKAVKREAETIHKLSKFVPRYHGVVHTTPTNNSAGPKSASIRSDSNRRNHGSSSTAGDGATPALDPPPPPSVSLIAGSSFGVTDDAYLLLQSLTRTYARPCVMDLKMGTETYEPDCTDEKRRRESSKYCKQDEFGFRIIGMRVYDPYHDKADDKGFVLWDKEYGRSLLEPHQVSDAFRLFFGSGLKRSPPGVATTDETPPTSSTTVADGAECERIRARAASNVVLQLRSLRRWFEENQSLQFRASSLLLIYEGDPSRGNGDVTMLKMIDFGHVRRVASGGDPGYLTGIQNLIAILTDLLNEEEAQEQIGRSNPGHAATAAETAKRRTFV